MAQEKKLHAGHRQRMHERVRKYGLESLAEHEALEYLLYFTNAQKNTNPIAHALLEKFGDFAGVLEASEEDLCTVPGMGPASARLLHLMPQTAAYYHRSRTRDRRRLKTPEELGSYAMARFRGVPKEQVLLICLNHQRRITFTAWISQGGDDRVPLPIREVISQAVRVQADSVVLCHNHPGGRAVPSRQDLEATLELSQGLRVVGIDLLDHIIVTESEYASLRQRSEMPALGGGYVRLAQLREPEEPDASQPPAEKKKSKP